MEFKIIYDAIELELSELNNYLELITEKQTILINRDKDEINRIIKLEEESIAKIKKTEVHRENEFNRIFAMDNRGAEDFKIKTLINRYNDVLTDKQIKYLNDADEEFKNLVKKITDTNRNNLFLIRHSLKFIDDTINAIVGFRKKNIVDRKV